MWPCTTPQPMTRGGVLRVAGSRTATPGDRRRVPGATTPTGTDRRPRPAGAQQPRPPARAGGFVIPREKTMSNETLQHLNTNTLIGNTDARGHAWHYRADEQGGETNHYPG